MRSVALLYHMKFSAVGFWHDGHTIMSTGLASAGASVPTGSPGCCVGSDTMREEKMSCPCGEKICAKNCKCRAIRPDVSLTLQAE